MRRHCRSDHSAAWVVRARTLLASISPAEREGVSRIEMVRTETRVLLVLAAGWPWGFRRPTERVANLRVMAQTAWGVGVPAASGSGGRARGRVPRETGTELPMSLLFTRSEHRTAPHRTATCERFFRPSTCRTHVPRGLTHRNRAFTSGTTPAFPGCTPFLPRGA